MYPLTLMMAFKYGSLEYFLQVLSDGNYGPELVEELEKISCNYEMVKKLLLFEIHLARLGYN